MRREARKRTWRSENFFSSSRVRLGMGVSLGFLEGKERGGELVGERGLGERKGEGAPLLNFVEALEEGDGDEDDDGFFAVADFELEWWRLALARVI